jgi:hypothetical protein
MKCINCRKLDLQSDFQMSRLGFGKCAIDSEKSHSVSFRFERQCQDFEKVDSEAEEKRITWSNGILKAREMRK